LEELTVAETAKPVRVGIVGANWSLKVHGSAWRLLPGVEVAAVCTAHRETAEAAAAQFGIGKAYWDVAQMAADPELDIIDVGSRPAYRYDMVMAALQAGKHVYNALPFAVDLARARAMFEAQRARRSVGVVDAQFRWVPAAMHMKALVEQGYLGQPQGFNIQLLMPLMAHDGYIYPHSVWPEGGMSPYLWLGDPASGASAWRNFGSHSLLLLRHLWGEVEEVVGQLQTGIRSWQLPDGSTIRPETADLGVATLRLANGAVGSLQCGWAVPDGPVLRVELWGDRGRLLLTDPTFGDGISARLYAGDARKRVFGTEAGAWLEIPEALYRVPGTPFDKANAPPYMVSMTQLFADMLEAVRTGREGSPSFEEAWRTQRVIEAMSLSHQARRWVKVQELG
jgi:predicted dehydrogenase